MIFQTVLLGGLLAAGQASASLHHALLHRSDLERELSRDVDSMVATLTRREEPDLVARAPQISSTPQSGDAAKANLAAWETQTQQACMTALMTLNGQASNPSGIAVCYNLPFLDNQTGVFQAELRMYNISAPIDPWVGITAADVSMTLSYLGATVQSSNGTFMKRDEVLSWPRIRAREMDSVILERDVLVNSDGIVRRQSGGSSAQMPSELKVLNYVGKINTNLMGTAMTQATLQPLLIPQIVLSATSLQTKGQVTATLSSQEASFVNGVFSKTATITNDPAAAASASAAVVKAAPFVLPGTKLAFFPIGLVVTCVWTAGFFFAVGAGTIGRIQFREQYRRRVKREVATGVRTI